jgi:hypothetical protein
MFGAATVLHQESLSMHGHFLVTSQCALQLFPLLTSRREELLLRIRILFVFFLCSVVVSIENYLQRTPK